MIKTELEIFSNTRRIFKNNGAKIKNNGVKIETTEAYFNAVVSILTSLFLF